MQQVINRTPTVPRNVQESLNNELRAIAREYNEKQRIVQQEMEQGKAVINSQQAQIDCIERQLRTVIVDRNEARAERDKLLQSFNQLHLERKESKERLNDMEKTWVKTHEELRNRVTQLEEDLKIRDEQIMGKRSIWMETHSSSARRSIQTGSRDPFQTPSGNHGSATGIMSTMTSPQIESPLTKNFPRPPSFQDPLSSSAQMNAPAGPSTQLTLPARRRPNLPTGRAQPAHEALTCTLSGANGARDHIETEPGDVGSMALIVHQKDEDLVPQYMAAFLKQYGLIEEWAKKYANIPNPNTDRQTARSNDSIWAYMMNLTYPNHRQDAHTHVVTLLSNADTKFWFVMRMAGQYVFKNILAISAFYGFSNAIDKTLEHVKIKLEERGTWL